MRKLLTNGMWSKLESLLPSEQGRKSRPSNDNRLMVEGMLWRMRTGCPWAETCQQSLDHGFQFTLAELEQIAAAEIKSIGSQLGAILYSLTRRRLTENRTDTDSDSDTVADN